MALQSDERIIGALRDLNQCARQIDETVSSALDRVARVRQLYIRAESLVTNLKETAAVEKQAIDHRRAMLVALIGANAVDQHEDNDLSEPYVVKTGIHPKEVDIEVDHQHAHSEGSIDSDDHYYHLGGHVNATSDVSGSEGADPQESAMDSATQVESDTTAISEEFDMVATCPVIVRPDCNNKDEWVELRCYICGGNSSPGKSKFLKGILGFKQHLKQIHDVTLKMSEVARACGHRRVPVNEVAHLLSGGRHNIVVRWAKQNGSARKDKV